MKVSDRTWIAFPLGILALAGTPGCSSSDDDTSGSGGSSGAVGSAGSGGAGGSSMSETGTAELTFSLTTGARESRSLVDPLVGTVRAGIFPTEDVGGGGPIEGATQVDSVTLVIDLVDAEESAETHTTVPLTPGSYSLLGFLDLDDNGADTAQPDSGDPATLPATNQFDIVAGEQISVVIKFDLVL